MILHRRNCRLVTLLAVVLTLPRVAMATPPVDPFLERHWQRPLTHQGEPPEHYTPLESSLNPKECGSCHPDQFKDWQGSLHARAMGPGIMGQLLEMDPADRSAHQACLRCHAPLAEQADQLLAHLNSGARHPGVTGDKPAAGSSLFDQGLICAGCHMRGFRIYGPAAAEGGLQKNKQLSGRQPHDGWQTADAFESAEFCAACHQFEPDGYTLNGKLLENTLQEWRQSPQAARGESCQSCHMPDRRHLWRGIHDPAMVASGVTIETGELIQTNGNILASITLTNSGTGHRFPTYVTPRVVMEAVQTGADGRPLAETLEERVIARQVSLDLSRELFDTRLAPGETARLDYRAGLDPRAKEVRLSVRVEPDHFYRDFYRSLLTSGVGLQASDLLAQALTAAESSVYTLFEKKMEISLPD